VSNIFSIFMSHVEEDETIALAIKQYLETVFLLQVEKSGLRKLKISFKVPAS